jgi:hypothetical protein
MLTLLTIWHQPPRWGQIVKNARIQDLTPVSADLESVGNTARRVRRPPA